MRKANFKGVSVVLACAATLAAVQAGAQGHPDATVRFRVVDDAGEPVAGARADAWSLSDMKGHPGETDRDGCYSCFLRNMRPPVAGVFTKPGFYRSEGDVWKRESPGDLPTNTLTVVLKRVIDPVPMVWREVTAVFPRLDEPVGFDLAEGDWVAPDGKGTTADMLLTATKRWVSLRDYDFRVETVFPNEGDGLQSFTAHGTSSLLIHSDLMPRQRAPVDGYADRLEAFVHRPSTGERSRSFTEGRSWIFRTRTRKDVAGNIVAANYGWVMGDFMANPTTEFLGRFSFDYYYNPDPHSRSLEPKEIADRQAR